MVNNRGSVMIGGERARLKGEHWRSRPKEQAKPNIKYYASCLYLHCFLLKFLKYFGLKLSVYIQYFVYVSQLCSVIKYFQIMLHYLQYYTLVPLLALVSLMQILFLFCISCVLDMQLIFALLLITLRVGMTIYQLNVRCSHSFMIALV